jgi:hypothetical protein
MQTAACTITRLKRIYSGEVFIFFQSLRTPWADNVFVAVTELGNSFVNISMACEDLLIW